MPIRIVRLGSTRAPDEGLRVGTVRRPPRGVARERFSSEDWYDVWYPDLAPSVDTLKLGLAASTDKDWAAFAKAYRKEMGEPHAARTLDLLAALSHTTALSVGCYCEEESRCHRGILRALLTERGAAVL